MNRMLTALGLILAVCAFTPREAAAQGGVLESGSTKERRGVGKLGQNFPNPFNPETRIPFAVGDAPTCADATRQYRVKLTVLNLLTQEVAVPVLQGGTSGVAGGQTINGVLLPCGEYTAYWDGKVRNTGRDAPSGMYIYKLDVDGQSLVNKMIVVK